MGTKPTPTDVITGLKDVLDSYFSDPARQNPYHDIFGHLGHQGHTITNYTNMDPLIKWCAECKIRFLLPKPLD